jgi:putative ABC transport system permease protein
VNLIRLISWPSARRHLLRWILTASGIVLGVAVLVAIQAANTTVVRSFSQTVDRIAGPTQLQVFGASTGGVREDVLESVRQGSIVQAAAPIIEEFAALDGHGKDSLLILGVDILGDSDLREYDVENNDNEGAADLLTFLAQPDSLIITREYAEQNHLTLDSQIWLSTAEGLKPFTVAGTMRTGGLSSVFGGRLALVDIYAAQKMFGRGRSFDRIDVVLRPGCSVKDGQAQLARMLGPGFRVERPAARAQEFESLLSAYSRSMILVSIFALMVGVFIIYNSFSTAVAQRRFEIGVLRVLGATRGQIRALFLIESIVVGLLGSAVGVLGGLLLAQGSLKYISTFLETVYGFSSAAKGIIVSPALLVSALGIGVFTSAIAAILPAQAAAFVDPVHALKRGKIDTLSIEEHWIRRVAAITMLMISVACTWRGRSPATFYAGYALSLLAAVLLTPSLVIWSISLLRGPALWLRPLEGTLAMDSLSRAPRRTSATVSALMLSLAMVITLGGVSRAAYVSVRNWMGVALNPDLLVSSTENVTSPRFLFPPSMEPALAGMPGVADVQGVRTVHISVAGGRRTLIAADLANLARHGTLEVAEGSAEQMSQLASQGKGVIISENLSTLQNLHLNNSLEIPTPSGLLRLPIVGVVQDYTSQEGSLWIDRTVFRRCWKSDEVDLFRVYLRPLASSDGVKRNILEKFQGRRQVFVFTNRELKSYVLRMVNQWFGTTYLPVLIAVLVALLGVANTLIVSVTDRRRELAVLRSIGGLRSQIRRVVSAEALLIALVGLVLGLALGAANIYYALEIARRQVTGVRLSYQFPWKVTLLLSPAILLVAWISAIWPALLAVRGSLVESLGYE